MNKNSTQKLRVPIGVDQEGRLVPPAEADDGDFACPGCGSKLIVRGGPHTKVRRHFAHRSEAPCSQESILHKAAKGLIAQVLSATISDENSAAIQVHRTCCRKDCETTWAAPFRPPADEVSVECVLPSGRVADVAILRDSDAIAIVEIHVTHAVDDEKAADLGGLPCAELEAEQVIADPLNWHPREERARQRPCPDCTLMDELYRRAGVPRWIDQMKDVPGYEGMLFNEIVHWGRDVRFRNRYDGGGSSATRWTNFDVVIAKLATELTVGQWRAGARQRASYADAKLAEFPDLPRHVRLYWEVEAALVEHGGEWVQPPPGNWQEARFYQQMEAQAEKGEDRWTRIRRISRGTGQIVPKNRNSPYWVEPYRCWADSCASEMLVYSWKGHTWMTDDPPPEPRPSTIRYKFSKQAGGKYWANVCPACGRVQGENFIYRPNGPLPKHLAGQ